MLKQSFRAWLLERLLDTDAARRAIADDQIDGVAKRLGIDPELLLEVRARARIMRHAAGLEPRKGAQVPHAVQARHRRLYQFHLYMPAEIFGAWKDECEFRGIEGSTLLRALIHSYLMSSRELESPVKAWYWKGRRYVMGTKEKRRPTLERAVIPQGAKRALARRASRSGATSVGIVRALVLEALAGKHRKVAIVDPSMMYDDESRYFAGPPVCS